jgi:hypothetical protein
MWGNGAAPTRQGKAGHIGIKGGAIGKANVGYKGVGKGDAGKSWHGTGKGDSGKQKGMAGKAGLGEHLGGKGMSGKPSDGVIGFKGKTTIFPQRGRSVPPVAIAGEGPAAPGKTPHVAHNSSQ